MSAEDIAPGKLWFGAISQEIKDSRYGIICVTAEHRNAPWLLWEAGALYRGFEDSQFVVPLLINLKKNDLRPPLSHFQVIEVTDKGEMTRLMKSINSRLGEDAIPDELVENQMERCWQELQDAIAKALKDHPVATNAAGVERTFKEAADELMKDLRAKKSRSIRRYQHALDQLSPYLDHLPLSQVDESTLQPFKQDRLKGTARLASRRKNKVVMVGTVNKEIQTVRQVLSLAAGLRWLRTHRPFGECKETRESAIR
jgi:hypothetical protein